MAQKRKCGALGEEDAVLLNTLAAASIVTPDLILGPGPHAVMYADKRQPTPIWMPDQVRHDEGRVQGFWVRCPLTRCD